MSERDRGLSGLLWVPLVLVLAVPVLVHSLKHVTVPFDTVEGPLLVGREALDSLLAASRGRVAVVNFWATWCTPCVGELPVIDMVGTSMADSVVVVAVDTGDPDMATLEEFRGRMELSLPIVWLDPGEVEALRADFSLSDLLPVTVFLDPDGEEYLRVSGTRSEEFFREAVRAGAEGIGYVEHPDSTCVLHINVVGVPGDPLTDELLAFSIELAGAEGVDHFDPSVPDDLQRMRDLYLPETQHPYAQACVGTACGRPASTREELLESVETLRR